MQIYRKRRGLTMGSLLHCPVLWQSFWPQAVAPRPLRVPPPVRVRRSMCCKVTHSWSALNVAGSSGAFRVPASWIVTAALQGPDRVIAPNIYVSGGIISVVGAVASHAAFHASVKAWEKKRKKNQNIYLYLFIFNLQGSMLRL